jgi:hypothetical protein
LPVNSRLAANSLANKLPKTHSPGDTGKGDRSYPEKLTYPWTSFRGTGQAGKATGRLDILCKTNGRPLFVTELKAESESLIDDDRKQGLSYA